MGVRTDARRFIAWSDQSEDVLGFFWDICTEAVDRAGNTIATKVQVDATLRADFLIRALVITTCSVTLLRSRWSGCGASPTRQKRPSWSSRLSYSWEWLVRATRAGSAGPGGSGQSERRRDPRDVRRSDRGAQSMAPPAVDRRGIALRLPRNAGRDYTDFEIWGYVTGSTIGETVKTSARASEATLICIDEQLCMRMRRRSSAPASCPDIRGRTHCDRRSRSTSSRQITHVLWTTHRRPRGRTSPTRSLSPCRRAWSFPERFALALFGMFSDGTVGRLFSGHFGTRKSQYLGTLFQINSIPPGGEVLPPPSNRSSTVKIDMVPRRSASLRACPRSAGAVPDHQISRHMSRCPQFRTEPERVEASWDRLMAA